MKTSNFTKLSFFFLLIICIPLTGIAQMKTLVDTKKTYTGVQTLEVSGGSIEINFQGQPNMNELEVHAFLESNFHDQDIVFVSLGDVLKISHQTGDRRNNYRNIQTKARVNIIGPEDVILKLQAGSGKIQVDGAKGEGTEISVGSGSIKGSNLHGTIQVKAGSGRVNLEQINGEVVCSLGSGSAEIKDLIGNLDVTSSSGKVKAINVDGLAHVTLTSGNAQLEDVEELGKLRMTSGTFTAKNSGLGPMTDISGTSGNFRIQTFSNLRDFNYSLSASSGNLTVGNSKGGKILRIDNSSEAEIRGAITSGNISIVN